MITPKCGGIMKELTLQPSEGACLIGGAVAGHIGGAMGATSWGGQVDWYGCSQDGSSLNEVGAQSQDGEGG